MDRHRYILRWPVAFVALTGLHLSLAACAPKPLPPSDAVNSIRASRHNVAPPIVSIVLPRSARNPITNEATLNITNNTNCKLVFPFKGPSLRQFGVDSGRSQTVNVAGGRYEYAVDATSCGAGAQSLYGERASFSPGRTYALSISQQDIRKGGELIVKNNTHADLQMEIGDIKRTVGIGSATIPLPEGTHTATATLRCGRTTFTRAITFEMTQDMIFERTLSCITILQPAHI